MSNPRSLTIDDSMRDAITTAFADGNVVTVAYVDADGWAHVSKRGSTQVFDDHTLAIWVRKRNDGLVASIPDRPNLTLQYIDLSNRGVVYTFYGRAGLVTDPPISDRVWDATPEREQAHDPDRRGVAVLVDLQRIVAQGMRPEQNYDVSR